MLSEEAMKDYLEKCDKATSNIDAPILGEIFTPICCSCSNLVRKVMQLPGCKVFGKIPDEYLDCVSDDCRQYDRIPDCPEDMLPHLQTM